MPMPTLPRLGVVFKDEWGVLGGFFSRLDQATAAKPPEHLEVKPVQPSLQAFLETFSIFYFISGSMGVRPPPPR